MVLENDVVFGSVNANLPPLRAGGRRAGRAPTAAGCERLITRRVPLERWPEALERRDGDVKIAVDLPG